MDKQAATQHILDRLREGYSASEITDELSQLLKAPTNVTQRFVDHVAATHPEAASPPPPTEVDDRPEWMQALVTEATPNPEPEPETLPRSSALNGDLPPGLQALMNADELEVAPPEAESASGVDDLPQEDLPTQAQFEAPSEETENPEDTGPSPKVDLEELAEYVLIQLQKQRRHNDIVEGVCRHTGWHWNKSQRFVARVKTKNHDKLQARQNFVVYFVGGGLILIGLLMAIYGISGIADYVKLALLARTNPAVLLNVSPQVVIFALAATITGIGMIVGGGFGIGRALANQ